MCLQHCGLTSKRKVIYVDFGHFQRSDHLGEDAYLYVHWFMSGCNCVLQLSLYAAYDTQLRKEILFYLGL